MMKEGFVLTKSKHHKTIVIKTAQRAPLPLLLGWLGIPQSTRSPGQFLVRAQAWVAGPHLGCVQEATNRYFSPSLSPIPSL